MRYAEPHECYDIAKIGQRLTVGELDKPIPGTGNCDLLYGFSDENKIFMYVPENSILVRADNKDKFILNIKKDGKCAYAGWGGEPDFDTSQADLGLDFEYDCIKAQVVIPLHRFAYDSRNLEFIVESIPEEGIKRFRKRVIEVKGRQVRLFKDRQTQYSV